MNQELIVAALELARGMTLIAADDVCKALEIEYIGDEDSGVVTVESDGNLTMKHGDLASEAADTTIQLPATTAGTAGVIDVSDASANTLGEVVDHINASANWRARIVDGLRTDSANDTFLAAAEASASGTSPLTVYFDTDVALHTSKMLTLATLDDPGADIRAIHRLYNANGYSTYGSGTSTFQVYSVITDQFGVVISETPIWSEAAGATATAKDFSIDDGSSIKPANRELGYRLLVRIANSALMASQFLRIDSASVDAQAV